MILLCSPTTASSHPTIWTGLKSGTPSINLLFKAPFLKCYLKVLQPAICSPVLTSPFWRKNGGVLCRFRISACKFGAWTGSSPGSQVGECEPHPVVAVSAVLGKGGELCDSNQSSVFVSGWSDGRDNAIYFTNHSSSCLGKTNEPGLKLHK